MSAVFIASLLSVAEAVAEQTQADQTQPKVLKTIAIQPNQTLDIHWDHSFRYRLQLPTHLIGNWLLQIEQRGIDVTPVLVNASGKILITTDTAILSVGIERLAFPAQDFNGAWVELPKKTAIDSPGNLRVQLQPVPDPGLFSLLRQVMAGTAYLQARKIELPAGINCQANVTVFAKDPGPAAHCFKAAIEHYQPQYSALISANELGYFLADSARRRGLATDTQRLYLPLIRQTKNLPIQALALHGLAWTVWQIGDQKVAESFAQQAISSYTRWRQQDPHNLGVTYQWLALRNIACLILHDRELLNQAEACYLALEPELKKWGDRATEYQLIGNLGGLYYRRGDIVKARQQFEKAYQRALLVGDSGGQVRAQANIGLTEMRAGNLQAALSKYQTAVQMAPDTTLANKENIYRLQTAIIYQYLGDQQRASKIYHALESPVQASGDQVVLIQIYAGLANIEKTDGNLDKAHEYYLKALRIERQQGTTSWIASRLLTLTELEISANKADQAAAYFQEAEALLPEVETKFVRIRLPLVRGKLALLNQDYSAAITDLNLAVAQYQKTGRQYQQLFAYQALVKAYSGQQQWELAEQTAKTAIALLQTLRPENISLELRASFSSVQRGAYEQLIDLYLQRWQAQKDQRWSRLALVWNEKARAQTLLEAHGQTRRMDKISPALQQQRQILSEHLNALATLRLQAGQSGAALNDLNTRYETALSALENFDQRYLPTRVNKSVEQAIDLDKLLASLPENSAILDIYMGQQTAAYWVLSHGHLRTYKLAAAPTMGPQIEQILIALRRPGGSTAVAADLRAFSRQLDPQLAPAITRLMILPDGALHYLPFAALPLADDSGQPWLSRYTLSYHPWLRGIVNHDRPQVWQSLQVYADPTYALATVTVKDKVAKTGVKTLLPVDLGLYRLRGSRVEANSIATLAAPILPAPAELLLGPQASRKRLLAGSRADILHFATHGIFAANAGNLAGLALAVVDPEGAPQPWLLTARELEQAAIDSQLVVMSACDAGTGQLAAGEGLLGMVRAFQYTGVGNVVSSQWKVSDRAAVDLMKGFYRALLEQNQTVAAALHQAQLELYHSDQYSDPFYWAGFSDYIQQRKRGEEEYVKQ